MVKTEALVVVQGDTRAMMEGLKMVKLDQKGGYYRADDVAKIAATPYGPNFLCQQHHLTPFTSGTCLLMPQKGMFRISS